MSITIEGEKKMFHDISWKNSGPESHPFREYLKQYIVKGRDDFNQPAPENNDANTMEI